MIIPQHIIDSGARALFERDCKDCLNLRVFNGPPHTWEALHPNLQRSYKKRASAVIRATSKHVWDSGYEAGTRSADRRLRLALDILDGRFQPTDRIGDLHAAMTRALKGEL